MQKFWRIIFYFFLILWGLIAATPFWISFVYSLMPKENIFNMPPSLFPKPFTLDNYKTVLFAFKDYFPKWLINSFILSIFVAIFRTLFCAMGGYAFARLNFPLKNVIFSIILFSMMIPGQVFIVPNYIILSKLRLINQLAGVVLPSLVTVFGIFFMRQFFQSIPKELEESAFIDGANRWQILFKIILPVAIPGLSALALLNFQGTWNEFMWPLIVLQTPEKFTLPVGLSWFKNEYYSLYSYVLAGSIFNALPIIILFFLFQRYIMKSVAFTGISG